ncbi:MAG: hypothetical protein MMC23_004374 [Stictis urceolatum]|nr:hypothetical protein [Stictis urceolata]
MTSSSFDIPRHYYQTPMNRSSASIQPQARINTLASTATDSTHQSNGLALSRRSSTTQQGATITAPTDQAKPDPGVKPRKPSRHVLKIKGFLHRLKPRALLKRKSHNASSSPALKPFPKPAPLMLNAETMTDPAPLPLTPGRALPSPRLPPITTQQTIPEAEEEESPLAHINPDIFTSAIPSASSERLTKLSAYRREKSTRNNALRRLKYQSHCTGCLCSHPLPHGSTSPTSADSMHHPRLSTSQSRLSAESRVAHMLADPILSTVAPHLIPRPGSPSSEHSFASATTAYDRRGSAPSLHPRRSNSLPSASVSEFFAFAERFRPAAASQVRLFDEGMQGGNQGEGGAGGVTGAVETGLQVVGLDRRRARSPLRHSTVPEEEGELLSGMGALGDEEEAMSRLPAEAEGRRVEGVDEMADQMANEIEALTQTDGDGGDRAAG